MPKNVKGGSKHKKMKNTSNNDEIKQEDLILKNGSDQDYGKVEKLLGNCRVSLLCNDKVIRMGIIRGSMRKRQWLNIGSIVIYAMRAYEVDKVDIIHVYNNNVLKILENRMNLNFNINEEEVTDDIFTTEANELTIPKQETQKKNVYYNFSDSSDEEKINTVIDDDYINDI
jgi:translation initiation factor 1A